MQREPDRARSLAIPSLAPHPPARRQQDHAGHAGYDAMLVVHSRHAGLMSGEEARQRIRRQHEIDDGHDDQDDAEQSHDELHGWVLLKSTSNCGPPAQASRQRDSNQIRPRLLMVAIRSPTVHYLPWLVALTQSGAAAALAL